MRIGSLFSGYGGLDMGVMAALGGTVAWHVEHDKAPSAVLAYHWPDVPNYGDVTKVDWSAVEPVDAITGGSPCQDLSHAGKRAGMTDGTRSNLWVAMREAIAVLRPSLVIWENVRGAYSAPADSGVVLGGRLLGPSDGGPALRALGRVLGDLSDLGYDAWWHGLRAADVGAPHGRFRVFVVAYPQGDPGRMQAKHGNGNGHGKSLAIEAQRLLPTVKATNNENRQNEDRYGPNLGMALGTTPGYEHRAQDWGIYADAIARWEALTRPAPAPTQPSRKGTPQLSPAFSEWMMGLPAGHVTAVPGLSRNDMLKALGNGVVPQQAAAAVSLWARWADGQVAA